MVRVLPVASVPWRTRLGGLGKPDYQVPEQMGWFLVRRFGLTAMRHASCWICSSRHRMDSFRGARSSSGKRDPMLEVYSPGTSS